jgi:benzoyl-CoA reductase subunit C
MLPQFEEIVKNRHQIAQDYKAQGKQVIGFFCLYTPEELLSAAGILPVRILGINDPPTHADAHIQPFYCPLSRSVLDQGLRGDYQYLDGLVTAYSCDTYRGIYNIWLHNLSPAYTRILGMPSMLDVPEAEVLLIHELEDFQKSLEDAFDIQINEEDLRHAIEVHNANRQLLRQVYQLRQQVPPPITGTEFLAIILSSMLTFKEEHNRLLREFLANQGTSPDSNNDYPRLMLIGSEMDNLDIIRLIEEPGAVVVADDLCTGSRYFWNDCTSINDPLKAIAQRYLNIIPCPTKYPIQPKYDHILTTIDQFAVQGVIILLQKFCNPHEFELPYLQSLLKERQIPFVCIELDTTYSAEEIQNQAEALIERIE